MCGIFGITGAIAKETAGSCLAKLAHRGPDGSALWSDASVTLGHVRLAILDLSTLATQPMRSSCGRYVIVFNGEIYNFLEIRRELEQKGHIFTTESDTEVVLVAFREWREACLNRFNGMWSMAIWDRDAGKLFLARDRFGKKPLFYASLADGRFAFASEMKALVPLLGHFKPNTRLFSKPGFIFSYETTDETLIEGIKRFPAASYGWYEAGNLSITTWWNTLDTIPAIPASYDEQVEMFRELFLDACRIRMRSDVPIGTALSGGLDSSAIFCAMARLSRQESHDRMQRNFQHAFVASFPGTPLDETKYAKQVAEYVGVQAHVVPIEAGNIISNIYHYMYLFEEIYITSPLPFVEVYRSIKENRISVTLDGHGADELFGGYSFDYLYALRDAGFNHRSVRQILETYYSAWPQGSSQFKSLGPMWKTFIDWHLRTSAREIIRPDHIVPASVSGHPTWKRFDTLGKRLFISSHLSILPTLLRNYDHYSMANGVEIRMPFMDHRIVSFAMALPWSSKIRNGYSKAIIRDAMARDMPHEIAFRKSKIGFNSPIVDWMKGSLKSFFLDTIESLDFKTCSLIDPNVVAGLVRHVINSEGVLFADGEKAWTAISPFLWEKAFKTCAAL
ncbi:MAG TPA: asparagine synthase (glutamine-hydrolyzing) [Candidatus Ozemobacteraceae bacterium]|nr:asparagine synthase (glutamine-hydrolyzing) [Candidatus Ozemobacteraceae bacterium]